jgi:hypothetical protein
LNPWSFQSFWEKKYNFMNVRLSKKIKINEV